MAEANMMGVAGGLAKTGCLPIAVTYGVFATRRAYDQVAMALATGPSRGIVVAFLPGITTPFKATHQAIDDLALMRALAGMTVVDPADATELAAALSSPSQRTALSTSVGCAARSHRCSKQMGSSLARTSSPTAADRDRHHGARDTVA
jgi:transketolase C-terminal domain/subunit